MRTIKLVRIGSGSSALDGFLLAILLSAVTMVVASSLVRSAAADQGLRRPPAAELSVNGPDAPPDIEPVHFRAMAAADARAFNLAIPFSTGPNPAARPFAFAGGEEDRLRALDCLAAAVLYEAGDDPTGQRAVAQVILNRVRHPAFPRTICGVVFQGAERRTGCQFTFTCDGALARDYSEPLWARARRVADAALSGSVYKPVGQATHYHTDWVVPYWSSSLEKIGAVHTHLFFRWAGWWGTPPAFRFQATGVEPRIGQLATRFSEHRAFSSEGVPLAIPMQKGPSPVAIGNDVVKPSADNPDAFFVLLSAKDAANFAEIAAFTCGGRSRCKFMGWTDPASIPRGTSSKLTSGQREAVSFSYLRDRAISLERALWNCTEFKRPPAQCLSNRSPTPGAQPLQAVSSAATIKPLSGVRFKDQERSPPNP